MRYKLWYLSVVFLLCWTAGAARAQNVREGEMNGMGLERRKIYNTAQKQNRLDWVHSIDAVVGTQVVISFDSKDADATLYVPAAYTAPRLLAACQKLAPEFGFPNADFLTFDTGKRAIVDIEFNKYLQKRKRQTDFTFDLSRMADALRRANLPQPVLFAIKAEDASAVTLQTPTGNRPLTNDTFLSLDEIAPGTSLHFRAAVEWQGYAAFLFFAGLIVMMARLPWTLERSKRRMAAKQAEQEAATPDAEKIQQDYNKRKPQWMTLIGIFLPAMFVFPLMTMGRGGIEKGFIGMRMLLPFSFMYLPLLMFGGFGGSAALCWLVNRRRSTDAPKVETPEAEAAQGFVKVMLIPMMFMMVMPLFLFFPVHTQHGLLLRRNLVFALIGVVFVSWPMMAWRMSRKVRTILTGGIWYDMTLDLARVAGVRVKRVVVLKSSAPNAYATIFGTVGLTQGLLDKMEPDEIRAVIAQELGHLKRGHPRQILAASLLALAALYAALYGTRTALEPHLSDVGKALFASPILFILMINIPVMLLTGPLKRKREREADALAAQWTGEPELVIRALTKLHLLNASPSELKRSDEALSSHPSLRNRIEAIRENAKGRA